MTTHPKLADFVFLAALAFGLFLAFFHPAILDPHNFGWLLRGTDNGENALGLHAWLSDPSTGLSLRTTLLNAPDGVPLLFTDSNPLLAILTAPFAAMMAPGVQFVGIWILICFMLHCLLSWALLKPFAPSRAAHWCGVALLSLLPTLYARYIHVNLMAHWLILWAFWIFIDAKRARDVRWWIAVLAVATLVHNYMLLLVAAIWASAQMEQFISAQNVRERVGLVAKAALACLVVVLIISRLSLTTDFIPSKMYGVYGMPLDALWNPSNSTYSTLLPATEQRLRRAFEGFQYLGAGLLILIAFAPLVQWRTHRIEGISELHRRLLWLIPACVVLTLLSVTHQVDLAGWTIFEVPIPESVLAMLDPIRASARLFWPVAYLLVLVGISTAYRLPHRRMIQLLACVLLIQVLDMAGMAVAIRKVTAEAPARSPWKLTADPRWANAIAKARDVTFVHADPTIELGLFQEVAWRAVSAGKPVRVVYAARNSRVTTVRLKREDRDFADGQLAPDRLYVLYPEAVAPLAAQSRLVTLNDVRIVMPANYLEAQ